MLHATERLSSQFGEDVQGIHRVRHSKEGTTEEEYHLFMAGRQIFGDGKTLREAVNSLLKKVKAAALIALVVIVRFRNQLLPL